jgi:hypothetical protein
MDRTRLLAEISAARAQPDDVLYLERWGQDYRWSLLAPGAMPAAVTQPPAEPPGPAGPGGPGNPDAWMFYSGPWPTDHPADLPEFLDELLAEMDSMCGGADRCRWPLDQPYPLRH